MNALRRMLLWCALLLLLGSTAAARADEKPAWAHVSRAQIALAESLGIPVAFENKLGMRFVLVPSGSFQMGAPDGEEAARRAGMDRATAHQVTLRQPYYVQTTEVTNAQFRRVFSDWNGNMKDGVDRNHDDMPAAGMYRAHIGRFLRRIAEFDPQQRLYRLASEAEWEWAARAGTDSRWYWGRAAEAAAQHEHLAHGDETPRGPVRVASLAASPYGLHDMLGNVAEIVGDRYGPLSSEAETDPRGPIDLHEDVLPCFDRLIMKGGFYRQRPRHAVRWQRQGIADRAYITAGFRAVVPVVRDEGEGRLLPLGVDPVAAESGTPLRVSVRHLVGKRVERSADGRFELRPRYPVAHRFTLGLPRGRRTLSGAKDAEFIASLRSHPEAERIELRVPVYRTLRITGRVEDATEECRVHVESIARWCRTYDAVLESPLRVEPGPGGRFRLEQVPAIPGAPVEIHLQRVLGTRAGVATVVRLPAPPAGRVELALPRSIVFGEPWVLPSSAQPESTDETFSGSLAGTIGVGGQGASEPVTFQRFSSSGAVGVRVTCVHASGRPAVGAYIVRGARRNEKGDILSVEDVARSDATGVADFPHVPLGKQSFVLYLLGRRPVSLEADVTSEKRALSIHVPAPASLRLSVKRAEGGPAAWATIGVRSAADPYGMRWLDLSPDGTLRADPKLDHAGRHTLHNVPPGKTWIEVSFHGRVVSKAVMLKSGETTDLALLLPRSRGWGPGE